MQSRSGSLLRAHWGPLDTILEAFGLYEGPLRALVRTILEALGGALSVANHGSLAWPLNSVFSVD
eukprot:2817625-Pyramimonas_sp.AAC.1